MRVLMVSSSFHPVNAGAEAFCLALCKALRERDVDARVLTARWRKAWPAREEVQGVPVRRYGGGFELFDRPGLRRLGRYGYIPPLVRALREELDGVDVLHAHDPERHAAVACAMAAKRGIARVVKDGNPVSSLERIRRGELGPLDRALVGHLLAADRFVVPSADLERQLRALDLEGIELIPNGVERPERVKEDHATLHDPLSIIVAARLEGQKRMDVVVDAAELLVAEGLRFRIACHGRGSLEPLLAADIERRGLGEQVRLAGHQPRIRDRFPDHDLTLLASDSEGLSNTLLEALAAGLPVVTTALPENLVVVDPEGTLGEDGARSLAPGEARAVGAAVVFRPGDAAGLARAVALLAGDGALRARIAERGRAIVEAHYGIGRVAEAHLDLYRAIAR